MFKEIFTEAKVRVAMKNLPKEIGNLALYAYDKKKGEYSYTQIDYDEFGDYGDEGERYNQGYTLECKIEILKGKILCSVEVTDLGRPDKKSWSKQYQNMTFDTIEDLETALSKIVIEFDKL